ncbi:MAG TPA: hypothetical protein VM432_12215 [Bdellovibrionales bacterium]|nr:hypothetical protein [Bdellovibrionales bacterium]
MDQQNVPRKTNWYKIRRLGVLLGIGVVLLLKFQNCAPAPGASASAGGSAESFPVSTIDETHLTTAVSFPQEKLKLKTDTEAAEIEGVCDIAQHGSILGWRLYDSSGEEIGRGYSACESGRFMVELAPTQEFVCDQPYTVSARLGLGDEGAVQVSRSCHSDSI